MHEDPDMLRDLRAPSAANGGVFRRDEALMVFDANAAVKANADNFADLTLPDRLLDLIRRKPSPAVSWKQVRAAWVAQMRRLSGENELAALNDRMDKLLRARAGEHVNLAWLAHEVSFRSLVPVVLDGFSEKDKARMTVDALTKLDRLMRPPKADPICDPQATASPREWPRTRKGRPHAGDRLGTHGPPWHGPHAARHRRGIHRDRGAARCGGGQPDVRTGQASRMDSATDRRVR
jgi:hypothetical protein